MRKAGRPARPRKSALTTEVVASEAVGVAAVSSVMTTEALLEATEEASRTGAEVVAAVVEEVTTEEVRCLPSPAFHSKARLWEPPQAFPLPGAQPHCFEVHTMLFSLLVFPYLTVYGL